MIADPFADYIDNETLDSQGAPGVGSAAPTMPKEAMPENRTPEKSGIDHPIVHALLNAAQTLPGEIENMVSHPVDSMRDVGAGVLRGGQKTAIALGEAGQGLASLLTGGYAPRVDIKEEMGMGKERPVDLGDVFGSENNNPLAKAIGQYSGAIIGGAGAKTMLGTMANSGAISAIQADTGNRIKEGLIGSVVGAIPGVAGAVRKGIKAVHNYAHPEADANALLKNIGGGSETAEENIGQLAEKIKASKEKNVAEALQTKQPVIDAAKNDRIDQLPGFSPEKVAKIFTKDAGDLTDANANALSKAISNYQRTQNLPKLVERGEDIFGHSGLNEKQIDKLEDLVQTKEGKYMANAENHLQNYDGDLRNLHSAFVKNPTFKNADELQSQLGEELGYYQRQAKLGNLDVAGRDKLKNIKLARDNLKDDMKSYLKGKDPQLADQYDKYSKQWRENVVPYGSSQTLRDITRKGAQAGTTPGRIASEFKFPDSDATKIAEDIGQEGKNHILFNDLVNAKQGDVSSLVNAIETAGRTKGYQNYISPEVKKAAKSLARRQKANEYYERGKSTAIGGTVGLMAGGHPALGALAGFAVKSPEFVKFLAKALKK